MAEFANTLKLRKAAPNLGKEERIALEWLKDTRNKNLAVLKADKGGAKVLLRRDQVSEMIKSKLKDQNLYTDLGAENPMPAIMRKLREHWVAAVVNNHISLTTKFVAVNYLQDLQQDYCADLIQDSTMFLQKLDAIEESVGMKNNYLIFNMDVEALYDSIKRKQVNLAIRHAIE